MYNCQRIFVYPSTTDLASAGVSPFFLSLFFFACHFKIFVLFLQEETQKLVLNNANHTPL